VPAGHLVARLKLALHGHEDLDIFITPGGSSSPRCSFVDLVLEPAVQPLAGLVEQGGAMASSSPMAFSSSRAICHHSPGANVGELVGADLATPRPLGPETADLPINSSPQARGHVAIEDREFVVAVLARRSISSRSIASARSSLSTAVPIEHSDLDHRAGDFRAAGEARCRARARSLLTEVAGTVVEVRVFQSARRRQGRTGAGYRARRDRTAWARTATTNSRSSIAT